MDRIEALKEEPILAHSASHIFCIGFNRCCTSSLASYFRRQGIPSVHWKDGQISKTIRSNAETGQSILTGLEEWKAFFDIDHFDQREPFGYFKSYRYYFRALAEQYPQSLFIFNYRPVNCWIKSLFHHHIERHQIEIDRLFEKSNRILTLEYMQYVGKKTVYELVEALRQEYRDHVNEVASYFINKNRLVVFDLEELDRSMARLNLVLDQIRWTTVGGLSLCHLNRGYTKRLSIMICCMDRIEHLIETLPVTIEENLEQGDEVEIVVVHFVSERTMTQDNVLENFISREYDCHLQSGYLKYIRNKDFSKWMPGPCRHTAFWYTRGSLVYNLDCDNYTGPNLGRQIIDQFDLFGDDCIVYFGFNGCYGSGSFGRICLSERNHFRIGSYHYGLTTNWSHDDSLLLLECILTLELKILVSDKTSCSPFIEEMFKKALGITLDDCLLSRLHEYGLIQTSLINRHKGISHDRSESFKTVTSETGKELHLEDLQKGYEYIKNYFGEKIHLKNLWTHKIDLIKDQKIIFYTVMENENQLDRVVNLAISCAINNITLTVLSQCKTRTETHKRTAVYPIIWSHESRSDLLENKAVLVEIDNRFYLNSRFLLTRIGRLLDKHPDIDTFIDKSDALLVKRRGQSCATVQHYDFLEHHELVDSGGNYWLANLFKIDLTIWGDPIDTTGLDIGPKELERREMMSRHVEQLEAYCKNMGMIVNRASDKKVYRIGQRELVLTYGLFSFNNKIPIREDLRYLVWQPDLSFNMARFPMDRTLVLAKQKKTDYNTVILSLVKYLDLNLFKAISSLYS